MRNFNRMTATAVVIALAVMAGACVKPTESMIKAKDPLEHDDINEMWERVEGIMGTIMGSED